MVTKSIRPAEIQDHIITNKEGLHIDIVNYIILDYQCINVYTNDVDVGTEVALIVCRHSGNITLIICRLCFFS